MDAAGTASSRLEILPGYEPVGGGWRETSQATRDRLLEAVESTPRIERPARHVPPTPCHPWGEVLGAEQALGLWLNVYSLRGRHDFGIGNFSHLARLAEWLGPLGVQFIGLSPLHALRNRGYEISPYSPVSRLFLNPLYVDPAGVPEFARSREIQEHLAKPEMRAAVEAVRAAPRIDYERTRALLAPLFAQLHAQFAREAASASTARHAAYDRFVAAQGDRLRDYATFVCLEDALAEQGYPRDWRSWPSDYHHPSSRAVADFRAQHPTAIAREQFIQFEADRQLGHAQACARASGMKLGLYRDLALSSLSSSFDAWACPEIFVQGVHLGAPPDDYAAGGQDWGLPPLDPLQLSGEEAHPYYRDLLDANLRSSGALRIDHVLGLVRQFWIPAGWPASEGAYVRFPVEDLLHHIGEASVAHRAVIVGEDLGTVPPELPGLLDRSRMLSCKVFFFERDASGAFRPPGDIQARALITATTHDFPTLAGYVSGRDLTILGELDRLTPSELETARQGRAADVERLHQHLASLGESPPRWPPEPLDLAVSLYRSLRRSPCALLGVGLDNLTLETDPVNIPGLSVSEYPCWSRRMSLDVEQICDDPAIGRALEQIATAG